MQENVLNGKTNHREQQNKKVKFKHDFNEKVLMRVRRHKEKQNSSIVGQSSQIR